MERRLAIPLLIVGWWFIVGGTIIFCGAVWNILSTSQSGFHDNVVGALMAAFVLVAGILFVMRSQKVLKGDR